MGLIDAAQIAAYDQYSEAEESRHLNEVADFVAIPTLAMVKGHAPDLIRDAEYLKAKLEAMGMKHATVHPADGFPLVTAEWMEARPKNQKMDPELWDKIFGTDLNFRPKTPTSPMTHQPSHGRLEGLVSVFPSTIAFVTTAP